MRIETKVWLIALGSATGAAAALSPVPLEGNMFGLFLALMSLPAAAALIKFAPWPRSVITLGVLSLFAWSAAAFTSWSGWTGEIMYSERAGSLILGIVPWTAAFVWVPLLFAAQSLAWRMVKTPAFEFAITALGLLLSDLALEPAALRLGLWRYAESGTPFASYLAWFLAGLAGAMITFFLLARNQNRLAQHAPAFAASGLMLLPFFTVIDLRFGLWLPALLGVAMSAALLFWPRRV